MKKAFLVILLSLLVLGMRWRYESPSGGLIAHYKMNENTASDNDELVVNGDFAAWTTDDPDGWDLDSEQGAGAYGTRDPEVSQVGTGESHADAGGEAGGMCNLYATSPKALIMAQNVDTVIGRKYRLSVNVDTVASGAVRIHNIGHLQWPDIDADTAAVYSAAFLCSRTVTSLLLEDIVWTEDVTVDDVSIKLCAAEDSSGNDHDGLLAEDTDTAHVAGKINGAFDFDGSADYIKVGNTAADVKSIAIWCNPSSVAGTDYLIDLNGTDYITIGTGTVTVNGFAASTEVIYVDSLVGSTVTANWHFVVITATAGFTASDLDIGQVSGSGYFTGLMDNVMLFSTTLTSSQVNYLYNAGRGLEELDTRILRERY